MRGFYANITPFYIRNLSIPLEFGICRRFWKQPPGILRIPHISKKKINEPLKMDRG